MSALPDKSNLYEIALPPQHSQETPLKPIDVMRVPGNTEFTTIFHPVAPVLSVVK